ncbi:MAG: hypothetical protein H6556_03380 [Lewinellaceae bacterium]|nr:hypothetical protein [Lewinellaceae bacterium]
MLDSRKYISVFDDMKVVKGIARTAIYDLAQGNIFFVPGIVGEVLLEKKERTLGAILTELPEEEREWLLDIITCLAEERIIHQVDGRELERFTPSKETLFSSGLIYNAVIELSGESRFLDELEEIIIEMCRLQCRYVALVVRQSIGNHKIASILQQIVRTDIQEFEVIWDCYDASRKTIEACLASEKNRAVIIPVSLPNKKLKEEAFAQERVYLSEGAFILDEEVMAAEIRNFFTVNKPFFYEAKNANPYFFKKVSIDRSGNIKNCLSQNFSYGNILDGSLEAILSGHSFQELWYVNKEKVRGCRDCEFRFACFDMRPPRKMGHDTWEYSTSCGYDVVQGQWTR